jgi:phosphoglycolate phosphatase
MISAPRSILFDFDGTLVDSAPSILAALEQALQQSGVTPAVPLAPALIGPPLRRTLATLAGSEDAALLDRLAAAFREAYDTRGYQLTAIYPGVIAMLEALHGAKIGLYIVTNKRIKPTRLILEHFGWTAWFSGIHALDSLQPAAPNKVTLVREVLRQHALGAASTWMIGDSAEDRQSALDNGLRFLAASWGYGGAAEGAEALAEPRALLRIANLQASDLQR